MNAEWLDEALELVKASGYVVLKEKSYRAAQERQRVAQCMLDAETERRESVESWAHNCLDAERRIRDRLTFVWGVACAHGATPEELAAAPLTQPPRRI